jgi:hypothetical protein
VEGRGINTGLWCGNLKERDHLEELDIDERIILKLIFRKWYGVHGLVCSGSNRNLLHRIS